MKLFIVTICAHVCLIALEAQIQVGPDVVGKLQDGASGYSISMPDANTIAVGMAGSKDSANHVEVYIWNGSLWIRKGTDIQFENSDDAGEGNNSICMPDANTLGIGAPHNNGNGKSSGHVRVYRWNGINWVQKGKDINGEFMDLYSGGLSGFAISMPDSNTIAIGAPFNDTPKIGQGFIYKAGHVRIYQWYEKYQMWYQKGKDIDGEGKFDMSGWSVSMPDANTVAIGAIHNGLDITGSPDRISGHVRIYTWKGTSWEQKGGDIDGEGLDDESGWSVSMPDANTVAIGAIGNEQKGRFAGHVRVYVWEGTFWVQKGVDIDGEAPGDRSGWTVSMPNSNTLAIGAPGNDANGNAAGQVRVYQWNGSMWSQLGLDIDGKNPREGSGGTICMPDANTVAIGGGQFDWRENEDGWCPIRVYKLNSLRVLERSIKNTLEIHPNPATHFINIKGDVSLLGQDYHIYDNLGKIVLSGKITDSSIHIEINDISTGFYVLSISENTKVKFNVIK